MTGEVKTAILHRFEACLPPLALRPGLEGYTRTAEDNLLPVVDDSVLLDFSAGGGGELLGDPPKFCAAHSSSALVANSFGLFRYDPRRLRLAGLSEFTEARFEQELPTGLFGTPPNLDFFATGPAGTVALESKFTEILSTKTAKFSAAYDATIRRLADPPWRDLYTCLRDDPGRFTRLDAAQLVKHYLGMRHSLSGRSGELILLYVYWEPTDAAAIPDFALHREELRVFSEMVSGSGVRFASISYPALWEEWLGAKIGPDVEVYVDALRARYLMPLQPPAF